MPIFLFFIALKIALTVAFFMGCAWLMAEYFPLLADKAIASSSGTAVDFLGEWIAKGLNLLAKLSAKFLGICFEWLEVLGFDFESMKESLKKFDQPSDTATGTAV